MTVTTAAAIPAAGGMIGCCATAVAMFLMVGMLMVIVWGLAGMRIIGIMVRAIAFMHLIARVHIIARVRASLSRVLGVFSWWMLLLATAIAFTDGVDSCLWLCVAGAFLVVAVAFVMLMVH